mmetsp:Transcript_81544/g.253397  ORF Transcript_81544/g.253397 Transcript_81544/m.253397 type:complete len:391 (-) Transcript_81544:2-1174(-)
MMGTKHSRMPWATLFTFPLGITKPTAARTANGAAAAASMMLKTLRQKACGLGQQQRRNKSSRRKIKSMAVSSTAAGTPWRGAGSSTCKSVTRTVMRMKGGVTCAKALANALDSGSSRTFQTLALRLLCVPRERSRFTCSMSWALVRLESVVWWLLPVSVLAAGSAPPVAVGGISSVVHLRPSAAEQQPGWLQWDERPEGVSSDTASKLSFDRDLARHFSISAGVTLSCGSILLFRRGASTRSKPESGGVSATLCVDLESSDRLAQDFLPTLLLLPPSCWPRLCSNKASSLRLMAFTSNLSSCSNHWTRGCWLSSGARLQSLLAWPQTLSVEMCRISAPWLGPASNGTNWSQFRSMVIGKTSGCCSTVPGSFRGVSSSMAVLGSRSPTAAP